MALIYFDTLFGQDAAIDLLTRAWTAGRLPHGVIFAGKTGVGKATTAAALGAVFLCHRPDGHTPCGQCESCRGMAHDNHPDFHVITRDLIRHHDKTGKSKGIDLSVKVIRPELIEPANRTAMLNHGKVFVVEEADLMNTAAQNALLKTLEEPQGRTLIILLTHQPEALLPTIRSRTQLFRFASLDRKWIEQELARRGIDAGRAALAAGLADGSLGLALRWLEDGVADAAMDLVRQVDRILQGGPQGNAAAESLPGWFKEAGEAYAQKQMEKDPLGSKDQHTRAAHALYLDFAARRLAQFLPRNTDPQQLADLCDGIESIVTAQQYLDSNVNVSLVFQQLAARLSQTLVV